MNNERYSAENFYCKLNCDVNMLQMYAKPYIWGFQRRDDLRSDFSQNFDL